MGYAYGRLMKDELKVMVKDFFGWAAGYISNNVTQLAQLPRWLRNEIGQSGVAVAKRMLDLNYLITKKYTPQRWDDEFKGVAAGSGISIKTWRRISLIPELLKASCSIGGWWGPATKSGQLIQLRSLDWEEHAPISKFPMITVYHPTEEGSVPFANIAWVGFFGSLTGYSSAKIGVSERLRGGPADSMTRFGKPWTYALRDVLQFSKTIDDALNNLNQTNRTCSVYLGIGSGHNNTYRIIEYSETDFRVYDDKTWHLDSNHPRTPGMFWKVTMSLFRPIETTSPVSAIISSQTMDKLLPSSFIDMSLLALKLATLRSSLWTMPQTSSTRCTRTQRPLLLASSVRLSRSTSILASMRTGYDLKTYIQTAI